MARIITRSNRPIAVRSGAKRSTSWFQFQPALTTIATSSTAALVFNLNALALARRPFTVVRSLWQLQVTSDQAAAQEEQRVGFAIAVVSEQASDIGITALPTPITDMESDAFFMYQLLFASESSVTDKRFTLSAQLRLSARVLPRGELTISASPYSLDHHLRTYHRVHQPFRLLIILD